MTKEQFLRDVVARGWTVVEDTAYGVLEEYPFIAKANGKPGNVSVNLTMCVDGPIEGKTQRKLRKSVPKKCQVTFSFTPRKPLCVMIATPRNVRGLDEVVDAALASAVAVLREHMVFPSESCPLCGRSHCDSYAAVAGNYRAAHTACLENAARAQREQAERGPSGSYFTGILGAILGALIASIPMAFLAGLLYIQSGWLVALIPAGAAFGYRLLRGRMTTAGIALVAVISMPFLLISDLLSFFIQFVRELEFFPGVILTTQFYFEVMETADYLARMWFPAIFMALGIFWTASSMRNRMRSTNPIHIPQTAAPASPPPPGDGVSASDAHYYTAADAAEPPQQGFYSAPDVAPPAEPSAEE